MFANLEGRDKELDEAALKKIDAGDAEATRPTSRKKEVA